VTEKIARNTFKFSGALDLLLKIGYKSVVVPTLRTLEVWTLITQNYWLGGCTTPRTIINIGQCMKMTRRNTLSRLFLGQVSKVIVE